MSNFMPIKAFKVGEHPDVIWIQTKDGEAGVACHYDCQWMRDAPDYDDTDDAFTWYYRDDGNHVELDEIDCWRFATDQEIEDARNLECE